MQGPPIKSEPTLRFREAGGKKSVAKDPEEDALHDAFRCDAVRLAALETETATQSAAGWLASLSNENCYEYFLSCLFCRQHAGARR